MYDPPPLSDQAILAVLQANQIDHERRITQNELRADKFREQFDARFEQMRSEIIGRQDELYRKIDSVMEIVDDRGRDTDRQVDKRATQIDDKVDRLQYWVMGLVAAAALQLGSAAFLLVTRVH